MDQGIGPLYHIVGKRSAVKTQIADLLRNGQPPFRIDVNVIPNSTDELMAGWEITRELIPHNSDARAEDSLHLPTHPRRCLTKAGVLTLGALRSLSPKDLLEIRGIGPEALEYISEEVARWAQDQQ